MREDGGATLAWHLQLLGAGTQDEETVMLGFRSFMKRHVADEAPASALVPDRARVALPPIDSTVPEQLETATFAAG